MASGPGGGLSIEQFLAQGTAALDRGAVDEATEQFTLAIMSNPSHPAAYCYRGECRAATEDYAAAAADFAKATEIAPEMGFAWRFLAESHCAAGDLAESEAAYQRAVEVVNDADTRVAYAAMLGRIGQAERALDAYDNAISWLDANGSTAAADGDEDEAAAAVPWREIWLGR